MNPRESSGNQFAKMQNLVKRIVTKKRSTTTMGGPKPLAASSFRAPKRGMFGIPKQRKPTQMDPELLEAHVQHPSDSGWLDVGTCPVKGLKTRMRFPDQSHERESLKDVYGWISYDSDTADYGASPPCTPSHISPLRNVTPFNISWTPRSGREDASSIYASPSQRDPRDQNIHLLEQHLDQVEAKEMNMIQQDLRDFQQARRKLLMDKQYFDMKRR